MTRSPLHAGLPLWRQALEDQLHALNIIEALLRQVQENREEVLKHWSANHRGTRSVQRNLMTSEDLQSGWLVDQALIKASAPFAWSRETMRAVLQASKSIPLDTQVNRWNLESPAAWWHFEEPLPFRTVQDPTLLVRALNFGWIPTDEQDFGMPCVCWIDAERPVRFPISPSMTWEWEQGQTLGQMLNATLLQHRKLYGPGGKWEYKEQVGEEEFMKAAEGMARFMLAGLAWLNQKVVTVSPGHVERHRRKEFNKKTGQDLRAVQVVQLRRATRPTDAEQPADGTEQTQREYTHRWVVSGHWRNQACGPKSGDRRLTYILPYVKGPDDKPLAEPRQKVYEVRR